MKTIIVAAPFSGIGKGIVPKLLELYEVIGISRSVNKKLLSEYQNIGKFTFVKSDHTTEESIIKAIQVATTVNSDIHGLIHFVGGSLMSKKVEDLSAEDFTKVLEVNLHSAFLYSREVYKAMKKNKGGNIILFGSTTGNSPTKKKLPYAVAKAGIHMLTKALALEGAEHQIIVNTIAPSYVMTERHIEDLKKEANKRDQQFKERVKHKKNKNPLKDVLYPEDLYELIELLLHTKKIQGQTIQIDLGQLL